MSSEHSRMSLIIVLAICCSVGFGKTVDLDPDEKAFLMSISMGRGLYYNYPHIVNLNASNFDVMAKGKDYSWIIEFYNSWCGHCLRFTPTYKRLANDIKDWGRVLKTAAVDCSNPKNIGICRDYEILVTPTLKYFKPHMNDKDEGIPIPRVMKQRDANTSTISVHDLRNNITLELLRRTDLPELQPFSGGDIVDPRKPQTLYIVLVIECVPMIGPQLVLDYWNVTKVTVRPFRCRDNRLRTYRIKDQADEAVYVMKRGKVHHSKEISDEYDYSAYRSLDKPSLEETGDFTRKGALTQLHRYFSKRGITVPTPFNLSSIKDISENLREAFNEINKGKKPYKHTGEVFQVDIEGALDHSLTMEVAIHKKIEGEALIALQNYLEVLVKYFPIGKGGKKFLYCVRKRVKHAPPGFGGKMFVNFIQKCKDRYNPGYVEPNNGWVGCHGTVPIYRGYPCSMWTMFHTLTVQAFHQKAENPQEVLSAMKGYMKNFFGCTDCAHHFLQMAANMEKEVKSLKDSVLYLWAAHNKANKRLHGDATEDPHFPKVQFPTSKICKPCHKPDGAFDEREVLNFLHHMYTHINTVVTPTQLGFNTTYAGGTGHHDGLHG
uniref:Sulfhydryl oxidase n=4 Tax=Lygus hesperus TaxID=30085 RepID=A0A0K8S6Z9_LYGHE